MAIDCSFALVEKKKIKIVPCVVGLFDLVKINFAKLPVSPYSGYHFFVPE